MDQPARCTTDFLGSLAEAKYLRNNGALSPVSENPFILGIKKKKKVLLLRSSQREAPLPSWTARMPARLVSLLRRSHLQIRAFQGEEIKIKSP